MELSKDEIDRLRQWYNAVEDMAPEYLEEADLALYLKIMRVLGLKPRPHHEQSLPEGK